MVQSGKISWTKEMKPVMCLQSQIHALKPIIILTFLICCSLATTAQTYNAAPDLGNVKGAVKDRLKEPFRINGGIALNSVFVDNTGTGITNPQPFTWIATGNINLRIFGYSMPFSFAYSNQKVQYTNPSFSFNRIVFNPRYKAWTAHVGNISSSFSPYTLSGYQYTGAGLDYNRGRWQAQVLYGRFAKAVKEDSTILPSYRRMGWGTKVVYKEKGKKIGLSLFHARDDMNSIAAPIKPANANVLPMEGTAFALEGSYPLRKNLTLDGEYSTSVLTRNLMFGSDSIKGTPSFYKNLVGGANSSTVVYHAIRAGVNYSFAQSVLGINYERVDPGYQTLGGYFFTNDFENIAANVSQNFWKGKMTASINLGLQKDDLANTKQSDMKRVLIAGNLGIRPSQKLNIGITYSNMQSYTFIRTGFEQINQVTPYQNLDTLNFTQLSQNAGLNIGYNIKQSKQQSQSISFNGNYMETANQKGDVIRLGDVTRFFNGGISHTLTLPTKNLSIATGYNYSYNYAAQMSGTTMGPMVNISKLFFKRTLRTNLGMAYNTSTSVGNSVKVVNIRTGASATLAKKHNLNMNIVWQDKTGSTVVATTYFTATMGYAYSF